MVKARKRRLDFYFSTANFKFIVPTRIGFVYNFLKKCWFHVKFPPLVVNNQDMKMFI